MSWQDVIITSGGFGFIVALIPTILGKNKPSRVTLVLNAAILLACAAVCFSKGMPFGAATVTVTATFWIIVAWQRHRQTRKINGCAFCDRYFQAD